jgi:hypothetical protein
MAAGLNKFGVAQRNGSYFTMCLIFEVFWHVAGVLIAWSAIEFVVLACCAFRSTICTCGLPSGICLRKFFENTRDQGLGNLKTVSARLPKNFRFKHPMVSAGGFVGSYDHWLGK